MSDLTPEQERQLDFHAYQPLAWQNPSMHPHLCSSRVYAPPARVVPHQCLRQAKHLDHRGRGWCTQHWRMWT